MPRALTGKNSKLTHCELCARCCPLTFHHLIPRKLHRRNYFKRHFSKEALQQGIMICQPCHRGLHKLFSEMELAKHYFSLERLQNSEPVQRHVAWVAKQKVPQGQL